MARFRVEIPIGERDVEAEQRRKNHHRGRKQKRRQHEQPLSSDVAVFENFADAQRHTPQDESVERRPPVGEADRNNSQHVRELQRGNDEEQSRSEPNKPPTERRPAGKHLLLRGFELSAGHGVMSSWLTTLPGNLLGCVSSAATRAADEHPSRKGTRAQVRPIAIR